VLSGESFDEYLMGTFLPYVRSFYDATVKTLSSVEEFLNLLIQAISRLQMNAEKVIASCFYMHVAIV
jgi:hypothetical protein